MSFVRVLGNDLHYAPHNVYFQAAAAWNEVADAFPGRLKVAA